MSSALAILVVIGTATFGASLHALVSHPGLYGWNWDDELSAGNGNGNIPGHAVASLLDHDPAVAAWTGISFASLQIDGIPIPVIGSTPNAAIAPPVLAGRTLRATDEIVLGATTLADLHKRVGDTVVVTGGAHPASRLRIVGTATMPTIGVLGDAHPTMGNGALLWSELISARARNPYGSPVPGPNAVLVRLRRDVDPVVARRSLDSIAKATSTDGDFGVTVVTAQRPAEIVNYRSMGATPAILGAALAMGAVVALTLTLLASVRRRRHDLALLKTLGYTRRQLAGVIAWQSSIAVAIGTIVGIPLGVVAGHALWRRFAVSIDAVSRPSVPVATIAFIALGALVLANLVAALPGRQAARTPTSLLLRAE